MNETFETRIEKVIAGGAGLGRTAAGRVVFVPGTLPGECVDAQFVDAASSKPDARLIRVLTPNPRRATPNCPLFLNCGGCDFLHATYEHELELKQEILRDTLKRIGKLEPPLLDPVPASPHENYRNFVQLKIDDAGRIGLFERDTHTVVPFEGAGFEGCRLQTERINRAVAALQGQLKGFQVVKFRIGEREFVIHMTRPARAGGSGTWDRGAADPGGGEQKIEPELLNRLLALEPSGILVNDRPVHGSSELHYKMTRPDGKPLTLAVPHDGFFQTGPATVEKLAASMARELAASTETAGRNLIDLYAGVGTFGLMLAGSALGVHAVELAEPAIACLDRNIGLNRCTNVAYFRGTAAAFMRRYKGPAGAVIVDPPRAGLEPPVIERLIKWRVPATGSVEPPAASSVEPQAPLVFYISCHPATLARDLAALTAGGYKIRSVQIFDQFCRTHHIESLAVLEG